MSSTFPWSSFFASDDANEAFPHWSTRLIPILRSWPQKPLSSNWRASSLCFHCIFAIQRFLITSHHFRFCVRRNGSWLVNNHRCPSCDKWSPDCLTNSAHTQTSRFMWKHDPRNTLSVMVTLIPGSFLLWNFYNLPLPNWIDAGEAILSSSSLEVLLWAPIPHEQTPDPSSSEHEDLLINRSLRTVKNMDQTSF